MLHIQESGKPYLPRSLRCCAASKLRGFVKIQSCKMMQMNGHHGQGGPEPLQTTEVWGD